jgi:hypothetical protein
MGDRRGVYRILVGDEGSLGVDGRIILIWFFKKWIGEAWSGLLWLREGTAGRHL